MRMNFDHDLVALDLSAMNMPSLDAQDGLNESEAGEPKRVRKKDVSASGNLMEALRKLRRASGGALRGSVRECTVVTQIRVSKKK